MSKLSLLLRLRSAEAAAKEAGDNLRLAENQVLRLRDAAAAAAQDVAAAKVALREEEAERELARKRKPILVLRYFGGELHVASIKMHVAIKYPQEQSVPKSKKIVLTKGHREEQPGLRGHSVGDIYPFVIRRRSIAGQRDVFDLLHVTSGVETLNFKSYELAFGCALHRLARPYSQPSKWYTDARNYGFTSLGIYSDEYEKFRTSNK